MVLLRRLADSENVINYKYLSYKIYFNEDDSFRFHEFDFLENDGTPYDLLDNLLTKKVTINDAKADQISFIINLMHGCDKNDLFGEKIKISVKKVSLGKSKL